MADTSGFYKFVEGNTESNTANSFLYSSGMVALANTYLMPEKKATYQYPVEGWYWFKNEEDAKIMFKMMDPPSYAQNK